MRALAWICVALAAGGQGDPKKAFDAALETGRFEEAARLAEAAPEAEREGLRTRVAGARIAGALRLEFLVAKEACEKNVAEARAAAAREATEESAREARIDAALRELTAKAPLKVRLPGGVTLENARVVRYAAGRVKLAWPQGEVEYPFELLPEDARTTLLAGLQAGVSPRDQFEIGKLLLQGKDYERAGRAFAAAVRRDPALAPIVPDLDRVRAAARLFEGSFKASGSGLGIRWSFSSADEARDFHAFRGSLEVLPGKGLEIRGDNPSLAVVRDIPFRERVKVSALAKESADSAHVLGLRFVKPNGSDVLIYGLLATSLKAFLVLRVEDGQTRKLLDATPGAAGNRMTMDFNRGHFTFRVGEKSVWSGNEGGFTEVSVLLGGSAMEAKTAGAAATFREVTLFGGVNPLWMSKKTAGLRDVLSQELMKDRRAGAGGEASLALSVDGACAREHPAVRDGYRAALEKVRALMKSRLVTDLESARAAMAGVAAAAPSFAPAWHYRGMLEGLAGNPRESAERYDRALELVPDFPEALAARALQHVIEGRWAEAREKTARALALKPDLGAAHVLRARLLHEAADPAGALEAARTARLLSPLDPAVQARAQMLAHVVRGPAWAKAAVHETEHYAVRGDLAPAKVRAYAEHLQSMRSVYARAIDAPAAAGGRRAPVLIFDSEEGYHGYMDFAMGDPQEHTLGAYSPWYGQLALFEDAEPGETLRVLAHEGFHQFLHGAIPHVPIWFNEGMAEYVAATRIEKGQVVEAGGILADRLSDLKAALKYGWTPLPFERIMKESRAEFYGKDAALKYAQAWSMIHFFAVSEIGLLDAYVARLKAGDGAAEAFAATFGKRDLPALEEAWAKHHGLPARAAAPGLATAAGADLLAAVRAAPGSWTVRGPKVVSPAAPSTLVLGFEPPEEYDVRGVIERVGGVDGLMLGLSGAGRRFVVQLDFVGETGLGAIDGARGVLTLHRTRRLLPAGTPMAVEVAVRRTGVRLTLNGAPVFEWKGALDRLSMPSFLAVPEEKPTLSLFLSTEHAAFAVSELSVKAPAGTPEPAEAELSIKELRESLASKDEGARLRAIERLGAIRDKEARLLLAEKMGSDTEAVRRAAGQAMAKQKHPQAADALEKAVRAHAKVAPDLAHEFIRGLGALDMCAGLSPLVGAVELEGGRFGTYALAEIRRIGCPEASAGLAAILRKCENRDYAARHLSGEIQRTIQSLSGGKDLAGRETWIQFVARGGHQRKMAFVHLCGATGQTFETETGRPSKCPIAGERKDPHEDTFLKHR